MGPDDPILGVTLAFNKDTSPIKINLGAGAYRTDEGKPYILESVKKAEEILAAKKVDHEYSPIGGNAEFSRLARELVFGKDSSVIKEKRGVTWQAIAGTGALRIGANFLAKFLPFEKKIYLPTPTWANHNPIFQHAGFELKNYRYYDAKTCGLDFKAMKEDVLNAPRNSVFLLHACAHNPTGVDPTIDQWKELSQLFKEKDHYIFWDLAYQGFATGDLDKDAAPIRLFTKDGHNSIVAQSMSKNFGLYGERVGATTIVCQDEQEAARVDSQMKILIRPLYSNPPVTGARIVETILKDEALTKLWHKDITIMSSRVISMRQALVDHLKACGSKRDWSHVTKQIGMFCFSGLTPEQVSRMAKEFHCYFTSNGRISVVGITPKNVEHLARSIHEVTK